LHCEISTSPLPSPAISAHVSTQSPLSLSDLLHGRNTTLAHFLSVPSLADQHPVFCVLRKSRPCNLRSTGQTRAANLQKFSQHRTSQGWPAPTADTLRNARETTQTGRRSAGLPSCTSCSTAS
jgi:hypothetical protein